MSQAKQYIAVDLGAESGRVMLASVYAERLSLEEIHRFANVPLQTDDSLRWNFPELLKQVKVGIGQAISQAHGEVTGIGVDTWGLDFGLLDESGQLLENPFHYRDKRTDGMMEKAFQLMPKRAIYENTGLQFMQINSLYQLLAMRLAHSPILARAKKLIFTADLVSYYLCGRAYAEYTLASTSQLMDMRTGQWSKEVFDRLDLPLNIFPEVIQPGTVVGRLMPDICKELGCKPINVIAIGAHDTASAVAAVPAQSDRWAYISSGTWSLMGIETPRPIINDKTFQYCFTNEGGVENTLRPLKNIMGLWLLQESKRHWQREGTDLGYAELTAMAADAEPFVARLNADCNDFLAPGNMPRRINEYLRRTGQTELQDIGQFVRVIMEGLAMKYRAVIDALEDVNGQPINVLHIVGGGTQNELLCQLTANAVGCEVITGPIEATAIGNVLMQARAAGQIENLAQGRALVNQSFQTKHNQPQEPELWSRQYEAGKKHYALLAE